MDFFVGFMIVGFGLLFLASMMQGRLITVLQEDLKEAKRKADLFDELQQYVIDWADLHQASLDDLKTDVVSFRSTRPREPHHQKSKPDADDPALDLRQVLPFGDYDFDTPH